MPIKPNRDYWHKINTLWDEQESFAKNPRKPTACNGTRFLYHGDQLVTEIPLKVDGNAALAENWEEAVYWLYQNDDFTPTARLHKGELHYIVADQVGTITDLVSEKGYIHYQQKLNLWGEAKTETLHYNRASNDEIICNHRFVGQYWDEESGLHYNRFRYYSPETAQYLQSDPIGLLGGFNPYGYVFDPTGWVDPLGLQTCPSSKGPKSNDSIHGNSRNSTKPQHGYEIYNRETGDVVKTGISGQALNKNGTSRRANRQVNALNNQLGNDTYAARVVKTDMPNRQTALDWEVRNAMKLKKEGNSMSIHKRPKPWE